MKKKTFVTKGLAITLIASILLTSCVSSTVIQSRPNEANLYINGEPVGQTPYTYSDKKFATSTNHIRLEKEGYETFHTSFSRDEELNVGALVGGIFLLFIPFLWIMDYKPTHTYELKPASEEYQEDYQPKTTISQSKTKKLRELKQLLDDDIITKQEYEKEKAKILNEN